MNYLSQKLLDAKDDVLFTKINLLEEHLQSLNGYSVDNSCLSMGWPKTKIPNLL